jgi:hypothetical protein
MTMLVGNKDSGRTGEEVCGKAVGEIFSSFHWNEKSVKSYGEDN